MKNKIKILVICFFIIFSSSHSYAQWENLQFLNSNKLEEGDYYIMTKDSVKHPYSNIDGFKLIKNNKFFISKEEKYPISSVIAYKAIYKRYGNVKNFVQEYKLIDGELVQQTVFGKINVYTLIELLGSASRTTYYLQKGNNGIAVQMTRKILDTLIYDMLKDFEPSKVLMDKKNRKIDDVVDAVNLYNQ